MEEETKPPFETRHYGANGSSIGKVSVRAWIVILLVVTACAMAIMKQKVEEPLYGLVLLTVGYYFGQNQKPK